MKSATTHSGDYLKPLLFLLLGLWLAYLQQEKYSSALNDFDTAIKLSPRYAMVYNNRGWHTKTWECPIGRGKTTDNPSVSTTILKQRPSL